MRVRLRPTPDAEEMALLYPEPHDHTLYADHLARVEATTAMAREMVPEGGYVVDLSCGNAAVAQALLASHRVRLTLGDYAAGWGLQGPIEETARCIVEPADLWILGETLEHLDDPELVLRLIRERARALVLSTPVLGEDGKNPQHLWAWSAGSVGEMLEATGWVVVHHTVLEYPAGGMYCFALWGCE